MLISLNSFKCIVAFIAELNTSTEQLLISWYLIVADDDAGVLDILVLLIPIMLSDLINSIALFGISVKNSF